MPPKEIRKKLTAVQARYLAESQDELNTARTALAEADKKAHQILTLVFDAVGLPENAVVRFDEATQELVADDEPTTQDEEVPVRIAAK